MATNDFLPFATTATANVVSQALYVGSAWQTGGFTAGLAQSAQLNKVWRQSSIISSVIAQFIVNFTGQNATDDGTTGTLLANFQAAIQNLTRYKLTGATNFYVNGTIGSDTNNGLQATAGAAGVGPWATIQRAITVLQDAYDLAGLNIVINVANGTYAPFSFASMLTGQSGSPSQVTIIGNVGSPSSVVISAVNNNCVYAAGSANFTLAGMELTATGSGTTGNGIVCNNAATVTLSAMNFGTCANNQILCEGGLVVYGSSSYTISGSAAAHISVGPGGLVNTVNASIGIINSPTFSTAFAVAELSGVIQAPSTIFTGTASGPRYYAVSGGQINTNGGGANYFPGSSAGTAISPGGYY